MPAVRGFPGVYVFFIGFLQVQEEVRQGIFKKREDDTQHKEGFEEKKSNNDCISTSRRPKVLFGSVSGFAGIAYAERCRRKSDGSE